MKWLLTFCLCLWCAASFGQQTPKALLSAGAAFNALSERQLQEGDAALLSQLAFGSVRSAKSMVPIAATNGWMGLSDDQLQAVQGALLAVVASGSTVTGKTATAIAATNGWFALSDHDLNIAEATLLSDLAAGAPLSAAALSAMGATNGWPSVSDEGLQQVQAALLSSLAFGLPRSAASMLNLAATNGWMGLSGQGVQCGGAAALNTSFAAANVPVLALDKFAVLNTGAFKGTFSAATKTNGVLSTYTNAGSTAVYLVRDYSAGVWGLKTAPTPVGDAADVLDNGLNSFQSSFDDPFFGGWEDTFAVSSNVVVVPIMVSNQLQTASVPYGVPPAAYWNALTNRIEVEHQFFVTNGDTTTLGGIHAAWSIFSFTGGALSGGTGLAVGQGYNPAFYHGDCEENLRGCIEQFSNTNLWQVVSQLNRFTTFGVVADELNPNSTTTIRNTQNIAGWGFVDLVYQLWQKTGDINAFRQFEGGCSNAMGVWDIYATNTLCALSNHLIFSLSSSDVEGPELFANKGYNPLASIYRYRALTEMQAMLAANSEASAAAAYLSEMSLTSTNIINYFWDSSLGLLFKTNVVSHANTHIGLVGPSAMAVVFGAVPQDISNTIKSNLISNFGNGSLWVNGCVNYYKTNGLSASECEAHLFFLPYACRLLDTCAPGLSAKLASDWASMVVGYGAPGDIGGVNFYLPGGSAKVEHYGSSFWPAYGYLRTKAAGQ